MAGMHRDKCGAAAVAGFFQVNDPTTWMINIDSCMYLFPTEPYSCSLDFSQVEAKTSEGYRLHGHGEEQRWCRSVWSTFFFFFPPSYMLLFTFLSKGSVWQLLLSNDCVCVLSDCYVADELVVSRAGRRVRVGNTDAEGRMVMVDLLCEMKEKVLWLIFN